MKYQLKKEKKNPVLLYTLCARFTHFCLFLLIALFLFYISGSYQGFLDSTQKFILTVCLPVSIILFIFSILMTAESIIFSISHHRKRYIWGIFIYLLFSALSFISIIFIRTVTFLSSGI